MSTSWPVVGGSKDTRHALRPRPALPEAEGRWRKPVTWSMRTFDGGLVVGYTNPASRAESAIARVVKNPRDPPRGAAQATGALAAKRQLAPRRPDPPGGRPAPTASQAGQALLRPGDRRGRPAALSGQGPRPAPRGDDRWHDHPQANNQTLRDAEVVECYKELARIEDAFRELKDFIDLRPIHHRKARRVTTQVFLFSQRWRVLGVLAPVLPGNRQARPHGGLPSGLPTWRKRVLCGPGNSSKERYCSPASLEVSNRSCGNNSP